MVHWQSKWGTEGEISFCNLIPCILDLQIDYQPSKYAKKTPKQQPHGFRTLLADSKCMFSSSPFSNKFYILSKSVNA